MLGVERPQGLEPHRIFGAQELDQRRKGDGRRAPTLAEALEGLDQHGELRLVRRSGLEREHAAEPGGSVFVGIDAIVRGKLQQAAYARVLEGAGSCLEPAGALQAVTRRYAGGLDLAHMAAPLHAGETQVRTVLPAGTTTVDAESFPLRFRAAVPDPS